MPARWTIFPRHSASRNPMRLAPLPPRETPPWQLRGADQAAVAILVALGLAGTLAWWLSQGGLHGRLVEPARAPRQTARFLVDVNTAEWPELAQLPGVGQTLAERIVDARHRYGPFRNEQDLLRVSGIGPKTLSAVRPYLHPLVGPPAPAGPALRIIGGK